MQRQRKWQIWLIDSELRSKVEQEENALRLLNNWRCFTIWKYTVEKSQTNAANVTIVCKLFWNHKCDHDVTIFQVEQEENTLRLLANSMLQNARQRWSSEIIRNHQKSLEIIRNYRQGKFWQWSELNLRNDQGRAGAEEGENGAKGFRSRSKAWHCHLNYHHHPFIFMFIFKRFRISLKSLALLGTRLLQHRSVFFWIGNLSILRLKFLLTQKFTHDPLLGWDGLSHLTESFRIHFFGHFDDLEGVEAEMHLLQLDGMTLIWFDWKLSCAKKCL